MKWEQILGIAPELNGLKDYFKNVPLTDEDRKKYDKFSWRIKDDEFSKLSYKDKEYYIDVYVNKFSKLTDKQFSDLPFDLKNKYISLGVELTPRQFDMVKEDGKLIKRYKETLKSRLDNFFEYGSSRIYNTFTKDDYLLMDGKTKERFEEQLFKDVNEFLDDFFTVFDGLIYIQLVRGYTYAIPDMFFIKNFISDKIKNKLKTKSGTIDFMGLNFLLKDKFISEKNQFSQFLDFIGKTQDEFFNNMGKMGKTNFKKMKLNGIF
jgi:hypothetical protein